MIEFSYPLGAELALAATSWPAPRRGAAAAPLETPHADARASPVLVDNGGCCAHGSGGARGAHRGSARARAPCARTARSPCGTAGGGWRAAAAGAGAGGGSAAVRERARKRERTNDRLRGHGAGPPARAACACALAPLLTSCRRLTHRGALSRCSLDCSWARDEAGGGGGSAGLPQLPYGVYLLVSCWFLIAATGTVFEYIYKEPIFGVLEVRSHATRPCPRTVPLLLADACGHGLTGRVRATMWFASLSRARVHACRRRRAFCTPPHARSSSPARALAQSSFGARPPNWPMRRMSATATGSRAHAHTRFTRWRGRPPACTSEVPRPLA